MSIQLNSITGSWENAAPGNIIGLVLNAGVGREARVTWGDPTPANPGVSGYGFRGNFPAVRVLEVGPKQLVLGRLRHFNHPINIFGGSALENIDLRLTFDLGRDGSAQIVLPFAHNETWNLTGDNWLDRDFVLFPGGFPFDFTVGPATFRLLGFRDEDDRLVEQFESAEKAVNIAWLMAELIDDGYVAPTCTMATSAFSTTDCDLPCILPITEDDIVYDCEVPVSPSGSAIEPIVDCPDIDLPAVAAMASAYLNVIVMPPGETPGNNGKAMTIYNHEDVITLICDDEMLGDPPEGIGFPEEPKEAPFVDLYYKIGDKFTHVDNGIQATVACYVTIDFKVIMTRPGGDEGELLFDPGSQADDSFYAVAVNDIQGNIRPTGSIGLIDDTDVRCEMGNDPSRKSQFEGAAVCPSLVYWMDAEEIITVEVNRLAGNEVLTMPGANTGHGDEGEEDYFGSFLTIIHLADGTPGEEEEE